MTELARPMSRRQATNRRELLLPSLVPDWHQTVVICDPGAPSAPAVSIDGIGVEPPRCWTRQTIHSRAAKQAGQQTDVAGPELIAENHLFARLVLQRVRPGNSSGVLGQQTCSPDEPQSLRTRIAPPDSAGQLTGHAETPVMPSVETLFTQLVRRRLRDRTTKETR